MDRDAELFGAHTGIGEHKHVIGEGGGGRLRPLPFSKLLLVKKKKREHILTQKLWYFLYSATI